MTISLTEQETPKRLLKTLKQIKLQTDFFNTTLFTEIIGKKNPKLFDSKI